MKRVPFAVVAAWSFLFSSLVYSQEAYSQEAPSQKTKAVETLPLDQIHAGMHGVAYTVFQGTKPKSMVVEVLGVFRNVHGPKDDTILVPLARATLHETVVGH